ncbi:MAG: DNA polymerase III subunit alpha, partial [Bacteroidales bacterium]|nr:DNA polymerase III subunit alpha [Bacteroidales bacterium]
CKIVSHGWLDGFYARPRIDRQLLAQYHEGIIVSSACLAGELNRFIEKNNIAAAKESALWYKNLFGDDFYIEIQRHQTNKPGGAKDVFERQQEQNKALIDIATELNIKVIATNDVHFVEEEHGDAHDLLICLSTGKYVDEENRMHYTKQEWLKSPEEMAAIFPDYPEALENTQEIVDKVEFYTINHTPIMPVFDIPIEFGTEDEYKEKYDHDSLIAEFATKDGKENLIEKIGGFEKALRIKFESDYLRKITYEGADFRYGEHLTNEIRERIDFELETIRNMGFPGYFLIVQDFIQAARNLGVSVGPGRGSAAGSVVAYCLKITDIDPLKYDLLFERFLNPDRISLPDIDIDFDDEGRGLVLDWVTKKYGQERVAHIITYGEMATKSSIKDVARVLRYPISLSTELTKKVDLLPREDPQTRKAPKVNINNCLRLIPELRKMSETNAEAKQIFRYAAQLEGTLRQTGIHACGVIISADDITNFVPVSTVEDKNSKQKITVTQFDGRTIEEVGLIKMDFLGLSTLTIIKECLKNIQKNRKITINIDHIPIDDAETYKLYSEGNTFAIFQFESPGMQKYLRELKPNKFEDLIAMNALYRPGPMDNIPHYVARKHGREAITYPFPILENRLKDTYGITVYQEQVMLLSRDLAGFTRGQSDELRKAMGKKDLKKMEALKGKFLENAKANGYGPEDKIEEIWREWTKFAEYAFNKSHATCYSWISYQEAYLKAHFPAEFIAANLTHSINDISRVAALIDDANKSGIKVLGPDINESDIYFTVNKEGNVRFGLSALKGSGVSAAEAITSEREENGVFTSIFDFAKRVNLRSCNKKTLEALAYAGAFDCFENNHRAQYFQQDDKGQSFIEKLINFGTKMQSNQYSAQISLFGSNEGEEEYVYPDLPDAPNWSNIEQLDHEKEVAGFYISGHPLDRFKIPINAYTNFDCDRLNNEDNYEMLANKLLKFVGVVTKMQTFTSKTGKDCGRITVEDYKGEFTWMIFGDEYTKFKNLLEVDKQLFFSIFIRLKFIDKETGKKVYNIVLQNVFFLEDIYKKLCKDVVLTLSVNDVSSNLAYILQEVIKHSKGPTHLTVKLLSANNDFESNLCDFTSKIDPEKFIKNLNLMVPYSVDIK